MKEKQQAKFHSVMEKPMGVILLPSQWTAKMNSTHTVDIMDYFL